MFFRVKNNNLQYNYPLTEMFNIAEYYEKSTGKTYNAIEIASLTDLLNLDAVCRTTNEYYKGLKVEGNTITILTQVLDMESEV